MGEVKLSKRLHQLASHVPAGSRIADIGSDHGLLVSYLVSEGISPMAIAGEINAGPFDSTKRQVEALGLSDQINVRLGDGLSVINEPIDIVIIAGMGGSLIVEILENGKPKLHTLKRIILQPNVGEEDVRRWLSANQWKIVDEEIIKEKQHFYEIIIAEQAKHHDQRLSDIELRVGPINLQKKDKLLAEKWSLELKKQEKVLKRLKNARLNLKNMRRRIAAGREQKKLKHFVKRIGA